MWETISKEYEKKYKKMGIKFKHVFDTDTSGSYIFSIKDMVNEIAYEKDKCFLKIVIKAKNILDSITKAKPFLVEQKKDSWLNTTLELVQKTKKETDSKAILYLH